MFYPKFISDELLMKAIVSCPRRDIFSTHEIRNELINDRAYLIRLNGYLLVIREHKSCGVLEIAHAIDEEKKDLFNETLAEIERVAKENDFKMIEFSTVRAGLMAKSKKLGYEITNIQMRKVL